MLFEFFLIYRTHSTSITYEDMVFDINESTYKATFINSQLQDLKIPETFTYNSNLYTVTSISPIAIVPASKIFIPKSIETIQNFATTFPNIKNIELGDGLITIGQEWFKDFANTFDLDLPDSVQTIGRMAFSKSGIHNITYGPELTTIKTMAFYFSKIETILPKSENNLKNVEAIVFVECSNLRIISNIIENLISIPDRFFVSSKSLPAEVDLPDNLETIETGAFEQTSVQKVTYGSKLKILHGFVFSNSQLTSFKPRAGETHNIIQIGESAFRSCTNLNNISLLISRLTKISGSTFAGDALQSTLDLPDDLESVEISSFINTKIKFVTYGPKLTTIGNTAFSGSQLVSFTPRIENNIIKIDSSAFKNCMFLGNINPFISKLTELSDSIFDGCISLQAVELPDSITQLKARCFALSRISNSAFRDSKIESIKLKEGHENNIVDIGPNCFHNCPNLENASLLIEKLTIIDNGLFNNCQKLTGRIDLPASLSSIGDNAFYGTGEIEITFGSNLQRIGLMAFTNSKIVSFNHREGEAVNIMEIGNYCFSHCENLREIG